MKRFSLTLVSVSLAALILLPVLCSVNIHPANSGSPSGVPVADGSPIPPCPYPPTEILSADRSTVSHSHRPFSLQVLA